MIRRNFYVDDCFKVVKFELLVVKFVDQLSMCFVKGGFCFIKWILNFFLVIELIFEFERVFFFRKLDFDKLKYVERLFGVQWNVVIDMFGFIIIIKDRLFMRRGVFFIVSLIYDFLGFVVFFILLVKVIL